MRAPLRPASRSRSRGYTAVEVMMAMTVMIIGASAVMSMQKTSIQGNNDARMTDIANSIARTWMERLGRDAMQWTCPSSACTATSNLGTNAKVVMPSNITGNWFLPPNANTTPETMSPGFDILGRDLPATAAPGVPSVANAPFCVNVRLTWLVPQNIGAGEPGLIRADVRVLWARGTVAGGGFCTANVATQLDPESAMPTSPFFHSVYMTTTIKETPAQ